MSKIVTFKTAQLAKQFGFNTYCSTKYSKDGELVLYSDNTNIYAPTIDDLQRWLEEEKGMYVSIAPEMYVDGINWNWQVLWYRSKELWTWRDHENDDGSVKQYPDNIYTGTGYYGDNGEFPTRYEALEAALQMALMKTDLLFRNNSIEGLATLYKVDNNAMLNKIRPFSNELGDWSFREFTIEQLRIILAKLGPPPQEQ